MYYNETDKEKLPNYIKWGAFIYTRYIEDIPKVLDSFLEKKERDIIMAGVDKLTHDDLFYTEAEQKEWDDWEKNSIEEDIRNTAKKEGIEQNTKETIIAMNKNNLTLDIISKVTNKTIEEIEQIIKESN